MKRLISHVLACLSAVLMVSACGGSGREATSGGAEGGAVAFVPGISRNDSLRFKMFYYEAVRQQVNGNFDAAYDLLRHCLRINPNAAEAYFMLSSYNFSII